VGNDKILKPLLRSVFVFGLNYMPKKNKKTIEAGKAKERVDKELSKRGWSYKTIAGAIIVIIGVALVLFNLTGVLLAFAGFVLIYFGLKTLGYTIKV